MYTAIKINKNKALLDLVSKHAEVLGYKKSIFYEKNSVWIWLNDSEMVYGTQDEHPDYWREHKNMDIADFLAVEPNKTLNIGCKTFEIDGDKIKFCWYTPVPKSNPTILKMIKAYEGRPQEFTLFGFNLEISPGKVVADGEEITEGINEFIKWAKDE